MSSNLTSQVKINSKFLFECVEKVTTRLITPVDSKPPSLHEGELTKLLAASFKLLYPVSEKEMAFDISTPDFAVCPHVDEEESVSDFLESPNVDEVGEVSNLHESFSQENHQVLEEDITFKENVDKSAEDGAYMQKWSQLQKYVLYRESGFPDLTCAMRWIRRSLPSCTASMICCRILTEG